MSVTYLQRLIDRTAPLRPQPPLAEPSGRSVSPVAIADQRLNDPRFAEDSSFYSGGFAEEDFDDTAFELSTPPSTVTDVDRSVAGRDIAKPPETRLDAIPKGDASLATLGDPSAMSAMSVGRVLEEDFVPPEPVEVAPSPEPQVAPAVVVPPVQAESTPIVQQESIPPPRQGDVVPPRRAMHDTDVVPKRDVPDAPGKPRAAVSDPLPMARTEAAMKAAAAESQPIEPVAPAPLAVPLEGPAEKRRDGEELAPVEAIPVVRPSFPEPRPTLRDVEAFAAPPSPASTPLPEAVKKTAPERPSAPPRQPRPMTAAEASIIGPLARRPRALTLFGLRRR